ncbi:MAG: TIGR03767 family metallophosphoesterase [Actinomycetota bacterium]
MSDIFTSESQLIRGEANELGWRNLEIADGEYHHGEAIPEAAVPILSLIHLSDLHICDAQSPARAEIVDRFSDPHNPISEHIGLIGAYRAQELLTVQTLESMVQTANQIDTGLFSARPIDAVVLTGDVTDNAQANELDWYLTLLDGGEIVPDSGDNTLWEGVAQTNPQNYDISYWNPEGTPDGCEDDFPRALYGFPVIKGLTDAVRKPFVATGIKHRWFATHGNHDALLQGTVASDATLQAFATGDQKLLTLSPELDLQEFVSKWSEVGPAAYPPLEGSHTRPIGADARRRINEASDWATTHLHCSHDGHGLTQDNALHGTKYWFRDIGDIRLISLDTVNIHGGWQGSLDESQFRWLKWTLSDVAPKYFVLLSHHPLHTLYNDYTPQDMDRRVCVDELTVELLKHDRIILWLAGHNHENEIRFVGDHDGFGFWHVMTSSLIDWPQQGRLIEIFEDQSRIAIVSTIFDHQSPISLNEATSDLDNPVNLAGLSRILSANDWQRRSERFNLEVLAGKIEDRNRVLWLKKVKRGSLEGEANE